MSSTGSGGVRTIGGGGARTIGGGGARTIGGRGARMIGGGGARITGGGDGVALIGDKTGVTGGLWLTVGTSHKSWSKPGPVAILGTSRGAALVVERGRHGGITGSGVGGTWGASGGGTAGGGVLVEVGVYPTLDAGSDLDLVFLFMSLTGTPINGCSSP